MFQHTAARGRLILFTFILQLVGGFQHTAARGRLIVPPKAAALRFSVSTHSRPRAADGRWLGINDFANVSTHSRPRAAEAHSQLSHQTKQSFNTQPPEGS